MNRRASLRTKVRARHTVSRIRATVFLVADAGTLLSSWLIAVALATWAGRSWWLLEWNPLSTISGRIYALISLLVIAGLGFNGQYTRRAAFWEETRIAWRYALIAALANFALDFFLQVTFTRTIPVLAWICALILLPIARLISRETLVGMGFWWRTVLVVGVGDIAWEAAQAIRQERHLGLRIAGFVQIIESPAQTRDAQQNLDWTHGLPVYEALCQPQETVPHVELLAHQLGNEAIVVVLNGSVSPSLASLVGRLHAQQFEIFTAQALRGLPVQGMKTQHFFSDDMLFLRLQHQIFTPTARILKRCMDITLSILLLIILLPLMAWVALSIWREDGGPVFYRQTRVGRHESDFALIKFRTMIPNADHALAAWKHEQPELYERYQKSNFKLADDPRVLRVGGWIRRLSIDELPQLWNVLRGDMSLVGPRPVLRRELPCYPVNALELYAQVRPGITGMWQVSGRSHTQFEDRANYDSWYVRNWSLWIDWVILLKTVRVVLSARGAM